MNHRMTVIIPTYRRVDALLNCLKGLDEQIRRPDELIVVVRDTDQESKDALLARKDAHWFRVVEVVQPGQVHALNTGIAEASGDLIAITDDDAIPRPDWLLRIEEIFREDPGVGGVGGRDWVHQNGAVLNGAKKTVGRLSWYGRIAGNHHLGVGEAREVDVLKGANMSYRRAALQGIRFERRLKGTGAQVHNDLDLSLSVKRAGWKLIYSPDVAVDHYPAPRFDEDKRGVFHAQAMINAVHNETLALLKHYPRMNRMVFCLWAFMIGTSSAPGLVQFLRRVPKDKGNMVKKLLACARGRYEGWVTWRKSGYLEAGKQMEV